MTFHHACARMWMLGVLLLSGLVACKSDCEEVLDRCYACGDGLCCDYVFGGLDDVQAGEEICERWIDVDLGCDAYEQQAACPRF